MNEWLVSQQFPGRGMWIVHRPGIRGNLRPNQIAFFDTRAEAEECAEKVKKAVEEIINEFVGGVLA